MYVGNTLVFEKTLCSIPLEYMRMWVYKDYKKKSCYLKKDLNKTSLHNSVL